MFSLPATVPIKPELMGTVAGYRFERWQHPDPANDSRSTLILKDRLGRRVATFRDYKIFPLGEYESHRFSPLFHIGRDPVVGIESSTGGAHGSETYCLWRLGRHPKCLIAYDKNNISDTNDFTLLPRSSGPPDIRSWYDGLAYELGGSFWPDMVVTLRYKRGRYVDVTSRDHTAIRQAERSIWKELKLGVDDQEGRAIHFAPMVELLTLAITEHREKEMWRALKSKISPQDYAELRGRRREIALVAYARYARYQYPKPYAGTPLKFPPHNLKLTLDQLR